MHPANQRLRKPDKLSRVHMTRQTIPQFNGRIPYVKGKLQNPKGSRRGVTKESKREGNVRSRNNQEYSTTHAAGS